MNQRRGVALISVLLLLTIVLYLSLAFLTRGNASLFTTTRDSLSMQSFGIAESAAQLGSAKMKEQFVAANYSVSTLVNNLKAETNSVVYGFQTSGSPITMGYADLTYHIDGNSSPCNRRRDGTYGPCTDLSPKMNPKSSEGYNTATVKSVGSARPSGTLGRATRTMELTFLILDRAKTPTTTVTTSSSTTKNVVLGDGFNFAYFMNHWAWWAGFSPGKAKLIGNSGANGNYDVLSGTVDIEGGPAYTYSNDGKTYTYALYTQMKKRDNRDYNPWAGVMTTGSIRGPGRNNYKNEFGNIPIPKDLSQISSEDSVYVKAARENAGKITVKTVKLTRTPLPNKALEYTVLSQSEVVSNGVHDGSVVLGGKYSTSPKSGDVVTVVNVDGPVVVKGNVVLQGYVEGRGTIYTGRNIYLAGDVKYANPPSTSPNGTEANVKKPSTADYQKDELIYAAGGSVIAGDVTKTQSWWTNNVGWWLTEYTQPGVVADANGYGYQVNVKVNDNHEDQGMDGIVNSQQYLRNPNGTYQNDYENDGKWTVQVQNRSTAEISWVSLQVINGKATPPNGWRVIPGTGEDTDGNGRYTSAYDYNRDFNFASTADANGNYTTQSFSSQHFTNAPKDDLGRDMSYSQFAKPINRIDGFVLANNAVAGFFGDGARDVVTFGGMIARHDGQIVNLGWGSSSLQNHQDARFAKSDPEISGSVTTTTTTTSTVTTTADALLATNFKEYTGGWWEY